MDGLPLGLATAGAYLNQAAIGYSDYLRLYKASWAKLQKTSPDLNSYEDRALYSTWQISFNRVEQRNELSAKLLRLWAYFDNQDLWFELLAHADLYDPEWVRELTKDELSFHSAIRVLSDHGLVEVDSSSQERIESRGYSIHGCVHSWTIHVLNQEWDYNLARLALKFVALHVPENDINNAWLIQRRLLPHAARCSYIVLNGLVAGDNMEWAYVNLGDLYWGQSKLDESEKMYQGALQAYEKVLGPDHISTLETVHRLGITYKDQGKLNNAEEMHHRALQGIEKAWGPDHKSTLRVVHNLGCLYAYQYKLDEAEKMFQRALVGYEKAFGPDSILILDVVGDLGNVYAEQGKLDEAEKMYRRALKGYEKALGLLIVARYRPALNTMSNLGDLFENQGQLREAKRMYSRAHTGFVTLLGPSSYKCVYLERRLRSLESTQGNTRNFLTSLALLKYRLINIRRY